MTRAFRNILLMMLCAVLLMSLWACKEESAAPRKALSIETVKVLPRAYINEPFDLWDVLIIEEGVKYSATAWYTETTLDPETKEYSFKENTLEVKDLVFTPVTLNNTIVTLTAKRGSQTATKVITIGTTVRADVLDDLYKSTGVLGWAEAGISKSVCNDSRYVKGENSATSLHVKFDGTDPHQWGQMFMELSNETAQRYFTDQIWDNAIVTFWVYNPMEHDIEFQLSVDDHTFPVMVDWTGEEGHFRRQFAKAGEWTQIFFSLRRIGTTHRLVTNTYSTESLIIKMQYTNFSTTNPYEFEFYLDDLDVVPAATYPEIDCTYTASNETLEQGWENMPQDTGWQGANTIYVYDEMYGDESTCSLYATFDSSKGVSSPFVVLNPEMMLGTSQMSGLPDMTGGTLSAYFKFEKAAVDVKVDLVKVVGREWQFSNVLPMQLTPVGNGWYKGTLDVNQFDFTTDRNDEIMRIRFTFSGISKSSQVWIDTVKFDYKYTVKVKESVDKDWINLPTDSGISKVTAVKYSTDYKKAAGSARSLQIIAPSSETGILTLNPEAAVASGAMSKLPNLTKGVMKAYFYFGNKTPKASMRLYNTDWSYCRDVDFIFENVGDGWYLGTIPVGFFTGYPKGNSSAIMRLSILIPAAYTVYVDGLMHYPNEEMKIELDPEDVFASGTFSVSGFEGNSGAQITTQVTNGSANAIHMWANHPIGWPEAGVRFALPVDMSAYEQLILDVKSENAHPWVGMKIYYKDANGTEQFAEIGADLTTEDWQTISFKLSKFSGVDLTKVTGIMLLANFGDSFKPAVTNNIWLDNLRLSKDAGNEEIPGVAFQAGVGTIIEMEPGDYATISFEYQLTSEGTMAVILRSPTWLEYYGDYNFDANGVVGEASGVSCETLDNGYIRVTMTMEQLYRTCCENDRNNAPETIALFDIYGPMTTSNGVVANIQTTLNENTPDEPDAPEIPDTGNRGEAFQAGVTKNILLSGEARTSFGFEYKLTHSGVIHVILRGPDWVRYYGDFAFNAEGEVDDYNGITTEKLDDGYIRVTVILSQLERSGCVNNLNNAPDSVAVMDIYEWGTASGYVDNIQLDPVEPEIPEDPTEPEPTEPEPTEPEPTEPTPTEPEPTEPEEVFRGQVFNAGVSTNIFLEGEATQSIVFEYKLTNHGVIHVILRGSDWIHYYGDYTFNAEGETVDYVGVTTEKLEDGYVRATLMLSQLERSGCVNNRNNAPASVSVVDIYEWTTASGYMDNIQLDTVQPEGPVEVIRGEMFQSGVTKNFILDSAATTSFSFDYKLTNPGQIHVILRAPDWVKYYGDFAFNSEGEVDDYNGITTEKLDDGYIRVIVIFAQLERSGCVNDLNNAPSCVGVMDIYEWGTASGYVDNIMLDPVLPEYPVEVIRGEQFLAGVTSNFILDGAATATMRFDYKLTDPGQIHVILRAPDWVKYYGDFAFNSEGEVDDYMGITTEKLNDGYIRVTVNFNQLERSGCVNNLSNAPASVGILDIYEWGTASGYVDNIQLDPSTNRSVRGVLLAAMKALKIVSK